MKERILYSCLLTGFCLIGLPFSSLAQSILSVSAPTTPVCPGSTITVTFTTSGTYAAGTTFTAYLSSVAGSVTAGTIIGSVTRPTASSGTVTGTIAAIIPASTAEGTAYRVGVAVGTGAKTVSANTVTITRPVPPAVTNPAPYCESATAQSLLPNATASAGGTLRWYAPNGTSSTTPIIPNTIVIGNTTYLVSQVVNGCESPTVAIVVTVKDTPNAPGTASVTYCAGQTASSLTATPVSGASLNWYTAATGGTASSIAPIPPTTAPGNITYYVSQTLNGCEGPRASLAVAVNPIPAPPTAASPPPYCEGATAVALTANGQNLRWYGTNQTGGRSSTSPTIPSTDQAGTTIYYVSQIVSGCESTTRTGISVTVKPTPGQPGMATGPSYCQKEPATALVATASAGATLNWYGTLAVGGTASTSATVPNTNLPGTVTYYVSQTIDGCEGPRKGIAVTVKPTPTAPGVSSPLIACQNRTGYALTATPSAGGSLNWYGTLATGGVATTTPQALSTTTVGSTTYYVSQSVNACEGPRAALTVVVNPVPAPPTAQVVNPYCEGATAAPLVASGQNLQWYGTNQTGGSFSGNAPVPGTATSAIGTTTYYVSQRVNGCESDRTGIPVRVKVTPNKPTVQNASFCQFYPATPVGATAVPNATLNWFGESASGGIRSDTPPVVPNNVDKTYTYYVSQTLDGCESGLGSASGRAQISVRVKPTPGAPGVNNIALCNNDQASPLQASGSNLKWYTNIDSPIQGTPTPNTGLVGDQIYKVTQTNDGCESLQKATLVVTIKPLPGAPSVRNVSYCQIQQDQPPQSVVSLAGNADGQSLRWFSASGSEISVPTPAIDRAGTQTYQVSQTVNGCQGSRATIQVTINTLAAPTTPKPVTTYCVNDKSVPFEATGAVGSQLKWIDPYNRLTDVAPTPPTINTNIDPKGDAYYVYQIGTNGCYSPRATLRVIVTSPPTLALAAPVSSVNLGLRAPLQLKFTSAGPYSYSITGGYSGTSRSADTTISVLPRGNTIYQVESVSNGCGVGLPGSPATAQITVRVPTIATSSIAATTLCTGTNLTVPFTTSGQFNTGNAFRMELISVADTTKKVPVQTTSGGSPITGPLPVTLTAGQYYVRVTASNPEIAIVGSNSPSVITVRTVPTASLAGTQTIYEGIPASLTFTFSGSAPWSVLYADSLTTYSFTTTANPYIAEARPTRTTTYQLLGVSNECGSGPLSGTATITVAPLLGVEDNLLDPLVKTYPVPTQTTLLVELDLPLTRDAAILSLTDASGRPVLQRTTRSQRNELDLTAQPSGLYLLRIQVGDRQTVRKVVKN